MTKNSRRAIPADHTRASSGQPAGPSRFQQQNDQALAQLRTFQTALRRAFPRDGKVKR